MLFVGRGRRVARLSGLAVGRLRFGALMAGSLVAAIAGVLYAGTSASADPNSGDSFMLPAFAAAFLGSTSIVPGRFNAWGSFAAVYFLVTESMASRCWASRFSCKTCSTAEPWSSPSRSRSLCAAPKRVSLISPRRGTGPSFANCRQTVQNLGREQSRDGGAAPDRPAFPALRPIGRAYQWSSGPQILDGLTAEEKEVGDSACSKRLRSRISIWFPGYWVSVRRSPTIATMRATDLP